MLTRIVMGLAALAFLCGRAGIAEAAAGPKGFALLDAFLDHLHQADPSNDSDANPAAESTDVQ